MKKKKIQIIINPVSGNGKQQKLASMLTKALDNALFDVEIQYTNAAGHAKDLSLLASKAGFDMVVAVGGDGSVHEVGTGLIGSGTALGILPAGSGNGLARHFKISTNIEKALANLDKGKVLLMDTIKVNGWPYLGVGGVGFDAHIANKFSHYGKRGFWSYVKIVWKEFASYKPVKYKLEIDGKPLEREAFMICVANSSQFGNNAYIAPMADVQDGLMDVCILKKVGVFSFVPTVLRLFLKTIHRSKHVEIFQCKILTVKNNIGGWVNLDGEPVKIAENLEFKIVPGSLHVLIPA